MVMSSEIFLIDGRYNIMLNLTIGESSDIVLTIQVSMLKDDSLHKTVSTRHVCKKYSKFLIII